MTFQYARRRKHTPYLPNPFKGKYDLKDGVYSADNWNRFTFADPKIVYKLLDVYKVVGGVRFDVQCIEGIYAKTGAVFHGIFVGEIRRAGDSNRLSEEELLAYKEVL